MNSKILALLLSCLLLTLTACNDSDSDMKEMDTTATSAQPKMPDIKGPATDTKKPSDNQEAKKEAASNK